MIRQRIYSLLSGYEDVNDQDQLRHNPMLEAVSAYDKLETSIILFKSRN